MAEEATAHNQAAYDQIAGLYAARHASRDPSFPELRAADARLEPVSYAPGTRRWFFYRQAEELGEQLRDAGLRVLSMTEEITSRHWLKILAGVT